MGALGGVLSARNQAPVTALPALEVQSPNQSNSKARQPQSKAYEVNLKQQQIDPSKKPLF